MVPETGDAKKADGVHIAYQVFGEGRVDLVLASRAMNVGRPLGWEPNADAFRRFASFARVLAFDRRGTGSSEHIAAPLPGHQGDVIHGHVSDVMGEPGWEGRC